MENASKLYLDAKELFTKLLSKAELTIKMVKEEATRPLTADEKREIEEGL
jgi:hypothetical protein